MLSRGPLSAAKPCTNLATCGPAAAAFSPIAIHIGVVIAAIERPAPPFPPTNQGKIKKARPLSLTTFLRPARSAAKGLSPSHCRNRCRRRLQWKLQCRCVLVERFSCSSAAQALHETLPRLTRAGTATTRPFVIVPARSALAKPAPASMAPTNVSACAKQAHYCFLVHSFTLFMLLMFVMKSLIASTCSGSACDKRIEFFQFSLHADQIMWFG